MNRLSMLLGLAVVLGLSGSAPAEPLADDVQDVVFLGETRPVLLRLHLRSDGKSLRAGSEEFLNYLFKYLDVNGDGVLSKDEAARAPDLTLILNGFAGRQPGRPGGEPAAPVFDDLDLDKDGTVAPAELAAYYRKSGLVPVRFQADAGRGNPLGGLMAAGGAEPSREAVSEAVFALLDADRDGKLSRAELAAAPSVLLARDADDDEIVTTRELVPNVVPVLPNLGGGMPAMKGSMANLPTGNHQLLLVSKPGEAPADLAQRMQQRYAPKGGAADGKLTRQNLGLEAKDFATLDGDGDGGLDAKELAGFVRRRPDLELTVRLGQRQSGEAAVALTARGKPSPLAGKLTAKGGVAALDLGLTRLDVRTGDAGGLDFLGPFIRQQVQGQFKGADKDGNGYLDDKEAAASRVFRPFYKAADRDGDGKLYEKEALNYLDTLLDLQRRVQSGCVTLVLSDQSRGLFDLLDGNHDGRLSVRELRGAAALLDRFGQGGRDYLTRADVPRSYQLEVRPGAVPPGGVNPAQAFAALYMRPGNSEPAGQATAGPAWFRKMDRNRDGDVSRREFLFSEEVFRQIDTDGDGLISAQEAEGYDAQARKQN